MREDSPNYSGDSTMRRISWVGDQYKDYYRNYLKSVEARLAAYPRLPSERIPVLALAQYYAKSTISN